MMIEKSITAKTLMSEVCNYLNFRVDELEEMMREKLKDGKDFVIYDRFTKYTISNEEIQSFFGTGDPVSVDEERYVPDEEEEKVPLPPADFEPTGREDEELEVPGPVPVEQIVAKHTFPSAHPPPAPIPKPKTTTRKTRKK